MLLHKLIITLIFSISIKSSMSLQYMYLYHTQVEKFQNGKSCWKQTNYIGNVMDAKCSLQGTLQWESRDFDSIQFSALKMH